MVLLTKKRSLVKKVSKKIDYSDFMLIFAESFDVEYKKMIRLMKTTRKHNRWQWAVLLSITMIVAAFATACSSTDDVVEPDLKPGDVVTDFKPVKQYSATQQFHTDLDALVTYAFDIRALRWAYFYMASKGFDGNEPFSATPDDIDNDEACQYYAEAIYTIIDEVVEKAEEYEEALQRLEYSQVLVRNTPQTRGILSDAWDFMTSCKKTQTMGRKSVVTTYSSVS